MSPSGLSQALVLGITEDSQGWQRDSQIQRPKDHRLIICNLEEVPLQQLLLVGNLIRSMLKVNSLRLCRTTESMSLKPQSIAFTLSCLCLFQPCLPWRSDIGDLEPPLEEPIGTNPIHLFWGYLSVGGIFVPQKSTVGGNLNRGSLYVSHCVCSIAHHLLFRD